MKDPKNILCTYGFVDMASLFNKFKYYIVEYYMKPIKVCLKVSSWLVT